MAIYVQFAPVSKNSYVFRRIDGANIQLECFKFFISNFLNPRQFHPLLLLSLLLAFSTFQSYFPFPCGGSRAISHFKDTLYCIKSDLRISTTALQPSGIVSSH